MKKKKTYDLKCLTFVCALSNLHFIFKILSFKMNNFIPHANEFHDKLKRQNDKKISDTVDVCSKARL